MLTGTVGLGILLPISEGLLKFSGTFSGRPAAGLGPV